MTNGGVSLEADNLVVIYHFSASEIWPDKRSSISWEWPYKILTTV